VHVIWIVLVAAYFVGAVPFGVLLARARGVDLRAVGSGNIGATNLGRALGKRWGIFCFLLDACKGVLPMVVMQWIVRPEYLSQGGRETVFFWWWLAAGGLAVLGHVFPVYLGFRGGKGVSTSFGVALGLWPYFTAAATAAIVIWALVLKRWRYVSLASIVGALAFPLVLLGLIAAIPAWSASALRPLVIVATVIPVFVVVLHRSNIRRLCNGTENRTGRANQAPES
jgi:glycerol-3-phosphate acyltransferase PlsY